MVRQRGRRCCDQADGSLRGRGSRSACHLLPLPLLKDRAPLQSWMKPGAGERSSQNDFPHEQDGYSWRRCCAGQVDTCHWAARGNRWLVGKYAAGGGSLGVVAGAAGAVDIAVAVAAVVDVAVVADTDAAGCLLCYDEGGGSDC